MEKNTKRQIIKAKNIYEIGLIEKIRKYSRGTILFKARTLPRLPALLIRTNKEISYQAQEKTHTLPAGSYIAAYKKAKAKEGAYYITPISAELAQDLNQRYKRAILNAQDVKNTLSALPSFKTQATMLIPLVDKVKVIFDNNQGRTDIKSIIKFKEDTSIFVLSQQGKRSYPETFKIYAGQHFALIQKKSNPAQLQWNMILPEDAREIEAKTRLKEALLRKRFSSLVARIIKKTSKMYTK